MSPDESAPKLHIDSDWKAQAQAEKERLTKQDQTRAAAESGPGGAAAGELPEADFRTLVGILAHQAIMGLGAMGDPKTGRVVVDLTGAKFSIDLLDILEQKTKGNLTAEEKSDLSQVLAELRSRFVQIANLVARQGAAGVAPAGAGSAPVSGPASPVRP
jgi:hypothetical protein